MALNALQTISEDFAEAMLIPENPPGYVQFEAVGEENYLDEGNNTRGNNCTSIDALMHAKRKDGKGILIPIEWKYTESYGNEDKMYGEEGETQKLRCLELIEESKLLRSSEKAMDCYRVDPFYQLMRQTLWIEQNLIRNGEKIGAQDYIHVHVIPEDNISLLNKIYPCSRKNMTETWTECLRHPEKYVVTSPKKLWSKQNPDTAIFKYLSERYWK
jgi:hypothetical protein